eukprot:6478875-Amphidinium_carterae.1
MAPKAKAKAKVGAKAKARVLRAVPRAATRRPAHRGIPVRPAEGLPGSQAAEAAVEAPTAEVGLPGLAGLEAAVLGEAGGPQHAECSGPQGAPEGAQHPPLPSPRWPPRGEGLSLQEALESRIAERAATRPAIEAVREDRRARRDRSASGSRSRSRTRPGWSSLGELQRIAQEHPGRLTKQGLAAMARQLGPRWGGLATATPEDSMAHEPIATVYLTNVLLPARGRDLGVRNDRELRTLAQALDMILTGRLSEATGTLMHRMHAIEAATEEGGDWSVAQRYELIPPRAVSSI